jgi:hypothetical protein
VRDAAQAPSLVIDLAWDTEAIARQPMMLFPLGALYPSLNTDSGIAFERELQMIPLRPCRDLRSGERRTWFN